MSAGARKTALNTTRSWQQHFVGQATQNMAMSFIGCGPQPRKTMFSLLTPGCNTLESDIKQFALLCEQNVEALWRSVWKFVYQVIMFGYFWPCRFVNCHAVDRSKAWAVVQGRGEASGNHHYQSSWFKQNCVQDTLSPQCFSRFAFRVCKQLLDWESPQAWLSFEPLGRMSISQQIRHLVKSWNWGQQFIQSNSIEFIRGVQKCTEKFHVLQLRSFQMTLIHWWRTFPSKWNAVVFWFHDLCIKPKTI